nr:unnamed protein product [Spirometra erinaceieuropaei]
MSVLGGAVLASRNVAAADPEEPVTELSSLERELRSFDALNSWSLYYEQIQNASFLKTDNLKTSSARSAENRLKNRYRDICPYDETRVVLHHPTIGDYINASYVQIDEVPSRRYILTQGPLQLTTQHFWQMVWEQRCPAIIMLNRILEKGTIKCFAYFPHVSETRTFDEVGLSVRCVSENHSGAYILREFELTNTATDETHCVLHFHYMRWPDFGVPSSPSSMLNFLWSVRRTGVLNNPEFPCVIHCSAGVGRSGTFVLIDLALVLIESRESMQDVDLTKILLNLRQCRMGIIQTAQQLRYSYCAVAEGGTLLLSTPPSERPFLQFGSDEDAEADNFVEEDEDQDLEDDDEEDDEDDSDSDNGDEEDECTDDEETHFKEDFLRSLKNKMFVPTTHAFENSTVSSGEGSEGEAAVGGDEEEEDDDAEIVGFLNSAQVFTSSLPSPSAPETAKIDNSPTSDDVQRQQTDQSPPPEEPPNLTEDIVSDSTRGVAESVVADSDLQLHFEPPRNDLSAPFFTLDSSCISGSEQGTAEDQANEDEEEQEGQEQEPEHFSASSSLDDEETEEEEAVGRLKAIMEAVRLRHEARIARQEQTRAKLAAVMARMREKDLARRRWLPLCVSLPLQRWYTSGYINNATQAILFSLGFAGLISGLALAGVCPYEADFKNGESISPHSAFPVEPPSTSSRETSFLQSLRDMQNLLGMTPAGALQRIKIGADAYREIDRRVFRSRSISSQRRLADEEFSRRLHGSQDTQVPDVTENTPAPRSAIARLPRFVVRPRQDGLLRMNSLNWDGGNNGNEIDGPQPRQNKRMRVECGPCDQPALSRPKVSFATYLERPSNKLLDDLHYSGRLPMASEQRNHSSSPQPGVDPTLRVRLIERMRHSFGPDEEGHHLRTGDRSAARKPIVDITFASPIDITSSHLVSEDPKESDPIRFSVASQRNVSGTFRPLPQPPEAIDHVRLAILMHPSATPAKEIQTCSCVRMAKRTPTDSDEDKDSPSSTPLSVDFNVDLSTTSRSSTFASDFSDEEATRLESLLTDREFDDPNSSRVYMTPKPVAEAEKEEERMQEMGKGEIVGEEERNSPTMTPLPILRTAHIRSPGDEEDNEDASEGSCVSFKSPAKTALKALPAGDEVPERIRLKQACQRQTTRAAYETMARQLVDDQAVVNVVERCGPSSLLHLDLPLNKWDDFVRQVWETAVAALRAPSITANLASRQSPPPEHTAGACSHFLAFSQSLLRRNLVHHLEDLQEAVAQKRLAHGLMPQVLRQIAEPSAVEGALRFTQTRSSSPPRLVSSAPRMVNQCNAVITLELEPEECHLNSTNNDIGSDSGNQSCPTRRHRRQQPR